MSVAGPEQKPADGEQADQRRNQRAGSIECRRHDQMGDDGEADLLDRVLQNGVRHSNLFGCHVDAAADVTFREEAPCGHVRDRSREPRDNDKVGAQGELHARGERGRGRGATRRAGDAQDDDGRDKGRGHRPCHAPLLLPEGPHRRIALAS